MSLTPVAASMLNTDDLAQPFPSWSPLFFLPCNLFASTLHARWGHTRGNHREAGHFEMTSLFSGHGAGDTFPELKVPELGSRAA